MTLERPFLEVSPCRACTAAPAECYCGRLLSTVEVVNTAIATATAVRRMRHVSPGARREIAHGCADTFGTAIEEHGAKLDTRAFVIACGCRPRAMAGVSS